MTPIKIIDKRKSLWSSHKDIEKDKEYREATANYMLSDKGKA